MEILDRLAVSGTTEPALQRVRRLCLDHEDDKYTADILSFLVTDAAIEILAVWADESSQAAGLERLARAAWANPEALEAFRPVRQVTRVEARYKRSELRTQYPAALSAAPGLIKAGSLANWLRRLICYLLLRSVDAVEDGVLRDEHVYTASLTAREAWQTYEHTRHEWLRPLVGGSTGLIEFEADTLIRCRQARRDAIGRARRSSQMTVEEAFHTDDSSPLRFYDALIAILEHRDWRPMPLAAARTGEARPLTPYPAGLTGSLEPLTRLSDLQAGGTANVGEPDSGGITVGHANAEPAEGCLELAILHGRNRVASDVGARETSCGTCRALTPPQSQSDASSRHARKAHHHQALHSQEAGGGNCPMRQRVIIDTHLGLGLEGDRASRQSWSYVNPGSIPGAGALRRPPGQVQGPPAGRPPTPAIA